MLIGENFEKISFELFGLQLLEPNGFISDILLAAVSLFFAFKVSRFSIKNTFFSSWSIFFVIFALSSIFGALGHLLFNYWGLPGKYPAWFLILGSVFFVERAMFSLLPQNNFRKVLNTLSWAKLFTAILGVILTILYVDLTDYSKGMKIPTLNTVIGLSFSLGVLSFYFIKKIHPSFRYFIISVLIMIPAALFQSFKINIHPLFDKNDASHVILIIGLIFYYIALKKYHQYLSDAR